MRRMNYHERMTEAREATGLSLNEVAYRIRAHLPSPDWVGPDVIGRIENGSKPETSVRPLLMAALAKVYGRTVEELSPTAGDGLDVVVNLLSVRSDVPESASARNSRMLPPLGLAVAS